MLPLRHEKRWRIAGVLILLIVLVAAVMPALWLWPDFPYADMPMVDKWLHALTFLGLSLWFAGQYERRAYWRLAAGLIGFGALIELCQGLLAYRMAEWMDLIADLIGTGAGLTIALAGVGGWSLRFEAWLARGRA